MLFVKLTINYGGNMRSYFIAINLLLGNSSLFSSYCLDASSDETTKIKYIKVMSERCSGSYYTTALIDENFDGLTRLGDEYGIKHFYPWFGYESKYYGFKEDYTFEGSENVLFVILFRDAYDWLRSLKRTTFLGPAELQICDFSQFIRGKWGINTDYDQVRQWQKIHPLIELNPTSGDRFNNVIEMRSAKIKNLLQVPYKVKNYYVINYEKVRDYPEEIVREIESIFHLTRKSTFNPVLKIRGIPEADDYVLRQYPEIAYEDYLYINNYLERDLERSIGYELRLGEKE